MAKSLRSKWKRKMRAVKRVRYGKKELEKLKTVVSKDPLNPSAASHPRDVCMKNLSDIATVVDSKELLKGEPMDDGRKVLRGVNLQDQNGSYPCWLGSHRRRKLVKANRKTKRQKHKKAKKDAKKKSKK